MILYFVFWTISKLRHDLKPYSVDSGVGGLGGTYLIFVIFFTRAKFLENKIYTEKTRKLRQNTQKIANFFALLRQNTR